MPHPVSARSHLSYPQTKDSIMNYVLRFKASDFTSFYKDITVRTHGTLYSTTKSKSNFIIHWYVKFEPSHLSFVFGVGSGGVGMREL